MLHAIILAGLVWLAINIAFVALRIWATRRPQPVRIRKVRQPVAQAMFLPDPLGR